MKTGRKAARFTALSVAFAVSASAVAAANQLVTYPGGEGPGAGRKVVLIAGDEEYRSEEAMPMLGKVLSVRHGFECVVLFSIDPETGAIDPEEQTNIPGLEELGGADLMVIATRFRELPDEQMKHIVDFVESGRPVVGLRTATHAFSYQRNQDSPYAHWSFRSESWPGGFGQQVLGETWINHHGRHGRESTRGVVAPGAEDHPILRGVTDVWGPTDVYGVENLGDDASVLLLGAVLAGMSPGSARRGSEERPDGAAGVDAELHRQRRQGGARVHDDAGRFNGLRERGAPAARRECGVLGPRDGRPNPGGERRASRGRVSADGLRVWQPRGRRDAVGPRTAVARRGATRAEGWWTAPVASSRRARPEAADSKSGSLPAG